MTAVSELVDKTGPATYKMMATVLTEVVDEAGEKWLSVPTSSRCFQSDRHYSTVDEAVRDAKALNYSELARSIEVILLSAVAEAGGNPRLRMTLEVQPCKVLPKAFLGLVEGKDN